MSTEGEQSQEHEVTLAHGDVAAVHLGHHYRRALPAKILKSRRTYAPIFMIVFACLGVWYLGLSSASSELQSPNQEVNVIVGESSNTVKAPLLTGRLAFGFWWEKYIFHYNIHLNFGVEDSEGLYEYVVARNGTQVYKGPETVFQDYTVGAGNSYEYKVWAVDRNGEYSVPVTYSTRVECTWILCTEEN